MMLLKKAIHDKLVEKVNTLMPTLVWHRQNS